MKNFTDSQIQALEIAAKELDKFGDEFEKSYVALTEPKEKTREVVSTIRACALRVRTLKMLW